MAQQTADGEDADEDQRFLEKLGNRVRLVRWALGVSPEGAPAAAAGSQPVPVLNYRRPSPCSNSCLCLRKTKLGKPPSWVHYCFERLPRCGGFEQEMRTWSLVGKFLNKAAADVKACVSQRQRQQTSDKQRVQSDKGKKQNKAETLRQADKWASKATAAAAEPEVFKTCSLLRRRGSMSPTTLGRCFWKMWEQKQLIGILFDLSHTFSTNSLSLFLSIFSVYW